MAGRRGRSQSHTFAVETPPAKAPIPSVAAMVNDASGATQGDLRLQPDMIPKLQKAFTEALAQLEPAIQQALGDGKITAPVMADPASKDFADAFNAEAGGSATQALQQYQQRLHGVVAQLGAIQQAYDKNESDTATMLSRQLES